MIYGPHSALFLPLGVQFIALMPPCFQRDHLNAVNCRQEQPVFHILPDQDFVQGMGLCYHL